MSRPRWIAWSLHRWYAMRARRAYRAWNRLCELRDWWQDRALGRRP